MQKSLPLLSLHLPDEFSEVSEEKATVRIQAMPTAQAPVPTEHHSFSIKWLPVSTLTESLTQPWICAVRKPQLFHPHAGTHSAAEGHPRYEGLNARILNLIVNLMFTDEKWISDLMKKNSACQQRRHAAKQVKLAGNDGVQAQKPTWCPHQYEGGATE